jgi:hypothetical protein
LAFRGSRLARERRRGAIEGRAAAAGLRITAC